MRETERQRERDLGERHVTFCAKCEHCQGKNRLTSIVLIPSCWNTCWQCVLLQLAAINLFPSAKLTSHLLASIFHVLLITLSISESCSFSITATFLLCLSGFCIILGTRQFLALHAQILRVTCAVLLIQKSPKQSRSALTKKKQGSRFRSNG